jgi:hypothetical protein
MERTISIPVSVVVARERIANPWQEYDWRPHQVHLGAPDAAPWTELAVAGGVTYFLAGTTGLELHRKEAAGYQENVSGLEPSIYVILRIREDAGPTTGPPLEVHLVTASPTEVQAYGEGGAEIIGKVAMSPEIRDIVEAFAEAHAEHEPFVKRQRQRFDGASEHKFGQEPIFELRKRRARACGEGGDDGSVR